MQFVFLLISISIACVAQYFFKKGAVNIAGITSLISKDIMIGLCLYGLSTLFYLKALKTIPLSVAYPMIALSYVFVVLVGVFFLEETISPISVMGLLFVLIGVFLLGWGAHVAS